MRSAHSSQVRRPPLRRAVIEPVADEVHIFESRGYQSMFVVDPAGVLVTDPMNPEAAKVYLSEIRKMTSAPIRYVVYSHHHYDHAGGGAPFKEAGATFVAHPTRSTARTVEESGHGFARPGGGRSDDAHRRADEVELLFMGRNHSDNSLVISVPAQKVIYAPTGCRSAS